MAGSVRLVLSAGLLVIDVRRDLLATTTIHLSAIVLATLWLTLRLVPMSDSGWFVHSLQAERNDASRPQPLSPRSSPGTRR